LPAFDESREDAIYSKLEAKAIEQGLDPEMLCGIWKLIIEEVKQNHNKIRTS
jgi:chorismate mutase